MVKDLKEEIDVNRAIGDSSAHMTKSEVDSTSNVSRPEVDHDVTEQCGRLLAA